MISIIIPVYNMEKYLDACVASIVNQEYKDIEVLLVDDGSKDNSLALCREWEKKDARIRVFTKENGGQGSARNLALKEIRGDYISFVDSDDLVTPDMYSVLMSCMEETGADMAVCTTQKFVDGEDVAVDNSSRTETVCMDGIQTMQDRLGSGKYISDSPCNKIYRTKLLESLFFLEGRLLEDSAMMYKIIDRCEKVVCTNKIGYLIRNNPTSVSRVKYNARRCDTILTFEEIADFILHSDKYKHMASNCIAFANGAVFYNAGEMFEGGLKNKEAKQFIKNHAKKQLREYQIPTAKNKILLWLIAYAFPLYGMIYQYGRRG